MANNNASKNGQGITGIAVSGFKSLCEMCHIEVRPLTILAGANSSGKSSIMQPLLLLKQTLEAPYDPGALLLDGPNVQFTEAEQFQSKLLGEGAGRDLVVQLEVHGTSRLTETFRITKRQHRQEINLIEMVFDSQAEKVVMRPDMAPEEIGPLIPELFEDMRAELEKAGGTRLQWHIARTRCFLGFSLSEEGYDVISEDFPFISPGLEFREHVRRIIHVPGLRGNPERTYRTTTVTGPIFHGQFQNYAASVIYDWQSRKPGQLKKLNTTLSDLGLTWSVTTKPVDDTQVELRVGRLLRSAVGGARDVVSIADVGFGVSQVLPVIVALLVAEPGQLVYLEQPELHLHPRAQFALAQTLVDAAKRGVRVVVETHSALLLLGIQSLVAEGEISLQKVKLHWFSRGENGVTDITSADLDEAGAFGDWPTDFDTIELDAQDRYLSAAERLQMGE